MPGRRRPPRTRYQAWYGREVWTVVYLPEAEHERGELPTEEQVAIHNAVKKLEAIGPSLRYPHSSQVKGSRGLRELRPRGGHCAWRPLYRRAGDRFIIAAIAPDGAKDRAAFSRSCANAQERLAKLEGE
jgi:hypothetical protein